MAIKEVLKEELGNSIKIKKDYEREISKLPKGSLIEKKIRGNKYYYLLYRENGKVKFLYKGKNIPPVLADKYKKVKELRAKYRKSLSKLKKQIKFLKGAIRGKEPI